MARYVVIALLAANPVTFLYEDGAKALAKVRTLQRRAISYEIKDGATDRPLSFEELEGRLRR